MLTGGGPNVAANGQVGKTNNQTLGLATTKTQEIKVDSFEGTVEQSSDTNSVSTESVENLTINEVPAWVVLLLVLGWLLPTPSQIANSILGLFKLKK